jgi:hypothetical protein
MDGNFFVGEMFLFHSQSGISSNKWCAGSLHHVCSFDCFQITHVSTVTRAVGWRL